MELVRTQELLEWHLPDRAPLRVLDVGGGPGVRWTDPARREALVRTARDVETEPALQGAGHLLAVGSKSS